jgi:orotate phosphoribosyltransferase-like protein/GTPase SAR1 family protein
LSRQGLKYERITKKNQKVTQRVSFDLVVATQEDAYFFIDTKRLPERVKTAQLTDEVCLRSLSDHCHREIAATYQFGRLAYYTRLSGKTFPKSFGINNFSLPKDAPELAFPLGVGRGKEMGWADLVQLHHLLVIGPTGKGKTTFLHSMLTTWADRNSRDSLVLWLVDLKRSEFHLYKPLLGKRGKPGLIQRLAQDEGEAVALLSDAVREMKRRQGVMEEAGAVSIDDMGKLTGRYLPRIVIVIDEILGLMKSQERVEGKTTVKQAAESSLVLLASQGRSAGLHVVIATQVIKDDVLTTTIRANYESVITFGLATMYQSISVLGKGIAEGLPTGRIMLKSPSIDGLREYQSCFISTTQVRMAVDRIAGAGPGGSMGVDQAALFLSDAKLLVSTACEQFDGKFAIRELSKKLQGTITWHRINEVGKRLESDGILERKGRTRRVAKGYYGRYDLLDHVYKTKTEDEHVAGDVAEGDFTVATTIIEGEVLQENNPSESPSNIAGLLHVSDPFEGFAHSPYMHKLHGIRFLSIRKWSTDRKQQQLNMMLEWKRTCDMYIVQAMAGEIVEALLDDFKLSGSACCVCNPPQGGSKGEIHFASLLAKQVAERLESVWFEAFEPRLHSGGHHPKMKAIGNVPELKRKNRAPKMTIILVDDISASGTTMKECYSLLKDEGVVVGCVWVAGQSGGS